MRTTLLATISVLAATLPAFAQDLTVKAPPHAAPIAIVNAAIHPVSREPIDRGWIFFDKGRITSLGTGDAPDLPQGTQIIDAKGQRRVYPGLISPYTQLGLTEIQAVPQTIDTTEADRVAPEIVAATAVNPDSTLIPVTRSNGILTAVVFPTGGLVSGQPSVIRLDGWTNTDMTIRRTIGMSLNWPNMRTFTAWWMNESEEDQQRAIKRDIEAIDRVFDTAKAYAAAKDADPSSPTDLRWEAMRPLFAQGKDQARLFVRANTVDQIIAVAAFEKKHSLRITLVGGREAPLCASIIKEAGMPVILLGTHNLPRRDDEAYDEPFTLPLRLHQAGIPFTISHNDDTAHERNLPYHVAMAVAYGLPRDVAIRSITLDAAAIAGVDDEVGSLEPGKAATLIITNGDPLEVVTRIDAAFIDGRRIDLSNKQTKLAEKYRERYRQPK